MKRLKAFLNWSSGKDSARALWEIRKQKELHVDYLITTISDKYQRVSLHGIRKELLIQQFQSIGIPYQILEIPDLPTNEEYEKIMEFHLNNLKMQGFDYAIFGDIFLEEVRSYRERQLSRYEIKAIFPLWGRDTKVLIQEFIELGFRAIVVSVNAEILGKELLAQEINSYFLKQLPKNVDPCGEKGEYHTFCFDGPIFQFPIPFEIKEHVLKTYEYQNQKASYWFCELLPK
ncbi:MAG: diphthine--ammonia ligase [Leptospiraceae bacterium]|nr:diphthine--ammonia ligase [Leptospiraceae bacterium]MDW7975440.1 diphthine--ammonia ligase [Leptospiraceae bacterium]